MTKSSAHEIETVTMATVNLSWGGWRIPGVKMIVVKVQGVGTSSEAIDRAIAQVKPLRVDQPGSVTCTLETYEREKPKAIAGIIDAVCDGDDSTTGLHADLS